LALLISNNIDAQLSGIKTIDPSGSGGNNYTSFSAAISALKTLGINGPVVFNVASGTFNEQITLTEIQGASAINTITFQSSSGDSSLVLLTNIAIDSTHNWTIKLDSADYITFQKITISALGIAYARVIDIGNGANNNEFLNNRIISKQTTSISDKFACVYGNDTSEAADNENLFLDNLIQYGSYGFFYCGGPGVFPNNKDSALQIIGNQFINQYQTGINVYCQVAPFISKNIISTNTTNSNFTGILLDVCQNNPRIIGNEILKPNNGGGVGIKIQQCDGSTGNEGMVINNYIHMNITGTGSGINNFQTNYFNYYYNSVNITGTATSSESINVGAGSSNLVLKNNIFSNKSFGLAFSSNVNTGITLDYNNIYTIGSYIGYWLGTGNVTTLAAWKTASSQAVNSVSINPMFVSNNNPNITNWALDNLGTPITGITTDIYDSIRSVSTPDLGCVEFSSPPDDAALSEFVNPINSSCENTYNVDVKLHNLGTITLTSANINWKINGTTQAPYSWTGNLTIGDSTVITLGSYSFTTGTQYNITALVSNPNNNVDANPSNDTAQVSNLLFTASPTSTFSINSSVCANDTITITYTGTASGAATYTWGFDGGTIVSGTGQGPYNVYWTNPGIKILSLNVVENSCSSAVNTQFLTVNSNFALITAVGSTTICDGDSVVLFANTAAGLSYQWFKNDTLLLGDTNAYYAANQNGNFSVEITNNTSCVSASNVIQVTVNPLTLATFTTSATVCNSDTLTVTYTGNASSSAFYLWDFDGGTIVSGSGQGPFEISWTSNGLKNLSLEVTENGCTSLKEDLTLNVYSIPAIITPLGSTSFCQGDSVTFYANTGNNFVYQWMLNGNNIVGANLPFYIAKLSGSYTVEVTDTIIYCSGISQAISVITHSTNFGLAFSASPSSFTAPPFIVAFDNQTPSPGAYYYNWSFGDGNISNFFEPYHTYQYDGTYSVNLMATNIATGCKDTLYKPNYISCTGGTANPCTVVAVISPSAGSAIICNGDSFQLSATTGAGWTYKWLRDGILIPGLSTPSFYAQLAGEYRVIVSDTICSLTSNPFVLAHYPGITPVIMSYDSIQPCTNDSMELFVGTLYNSYLWSTGATTNSIYVSSSGNFYVTTTDINGCQLVSQQFVVNASLLQPPDICLVGVDSSNHNRIIWEKPASVLIDSFSVYRETTVANVYEKIGTHPYSAIGVFTDLNSNPQVRAYRYRLTATDTCGTETPMSDFHKSIHLTINAGQGGAWNLIWDGYIGNFTFGSYAIYRGMDSTSMTLLTQIQSNLSSYTDLNPPNDSIFYQIEVINPNGCYPDSIFSKANTNYNSSRSNVANTLAIIPPDTTGIHHTNNTNPKVNIYPNPNNGNFQINISGMISKTLEMCIINITGQIMYCEKLNNISLGKLTKSLDFSSYSKGIYFIKVITEEIVETKKVIIQ
ncbi:T9SS type A sorting domain-containing protein, partial [Bacteroidota bacterium]